MASIVVYSKIVEMLSKDLDNFIILLDLNRTEASLSNEKADTYKITIEKVSD